MRSNRAGGAGIGDALHGWELRLMACFMVNNEFSTAVCMAPGGETDCSEGEKSAPRFRTPRSKSPHADTSRC